MKKTIVFLLKKKNKQISLTFSVHEDSFDIHWCNPDPTRSGFPCEKWRSRINSLFSNWVNLCGWSSYFPKTFHWMLKTCWVFLLSYGLRLRLSRNWIAVWMWNRLKIISNIRVQDSSLAIDFLSPFSHSQCSTEHEVSFRYEAHDLYMILFYNTQITILDNNFFCSQMNSNCSKYLHIMTEFRTLQNSMSCINHNENTIKFTMHVIIL